MNLPLPLFALIFLAGCSSSAATLNRCGGGILTADDREAITLATTALEHKKVAYTVDAICAHPAIGTRKLVEFRAAEGAYPVVEVNLKSKHAKVYGASQ